MTVNELSEAWNQLRNAALGRGTKPNVSPDLAGRVAREYERWRAWRADADPTDDLMASLTARAWVDRYRKILAAVQREGKGPKPENVLAVTPVEAAMAAADRLEKSIAWGMVGTGVAIALFILARVSKR